MKSVMKILDVFVIGLLLGLVAKGLSGWGGGWRVNHFVDIFGIYFWYFWDWLVVGVDCKRAKWMRWWLQGEPFCGYLDDIFGIFFQYFWEWMVVGVDCTRVKWLRWWLGGWPYCRERVKCNQLSDNATTRLTSSWNQRNNGTIEAIRKGGDEHDGGRQKHLFFGRTKA